MNYSRSTLRLFALFLNRYKISQRIAALALLLAVLHGGSAKAQNSLATVPLGPFPGSQVGKAVVVNEATNQVYALTAAGVSVIDGATNTLTTTVPITSPSTLAINSTTNKIYTGSASGVTVIDGVTNTTTTLNIGSTPTAIAVNTVTNQIYVANGGSASPGVVTVIDGATNNTTNVNVGASPTHIAINNVTNKIYVAVNGGVTVIDGATNNTTNVTIGSSSTTSTLAVNMVTNKVYVNAIISFNYYIAVIDGSSNAVTTFVISCITPSDIAINSATNKIYVPCRNGDNILVINGATGNVASVGVNSNSGSSEVAIDQTTNTAYVVNYSGYSLTAIDGSNNTATVSVGPNPTALAINSTTNKVYVPAATSLYIVDAAASQATLSLKKLAFVSPVNIASTAQTLTLKNTGITPMTINSIAFSGTDATQFSETDNCPVGSGTLAAKATCKINVSFVPTLATPVEKSASVVVNAPSPSASPSVTLLGAVGPLATVFDNFTLSQTAPQGTQIHLSGQLFPTLDPNNLPWPGTGNISVTIAGVTVTAALNSTTPGTFSLYFPTASIPPSATPYPILYSYPGDQNYLPTTNNVTTLTVLPVPPPTQPTTFFKTAGGSAMLNNFALTALYACGPNQWGGPVTLSDTRNPSIPSVTGNILVFWSNPTVTATSTNISTVCFYVVVDSVTAVRLYQTGAVVQLNPNLVGGGSSFTSPIVFSGFVPLPEAVYELINNQVLNAAITDIRPEDALFATLRALASPAGTPVTGSHFTGLGYGPAPIGAAIRSSQSGAGFPPVAFTISGNDPFTNNPARAYNLANLAASPLLVLVNASNTSDGHFGQFAGTFGNPAGARREFYNVNRGDLNHILTGEILHVRSIAPTIGLPDVPLHVFVPEPLSGDYNIMEYSVPNSRQFGVFTAGQTSGQETGVDPTNTTCTTTPCTVESGNPFWHIDHNGATRGRVLDSFDMVAAINNTDDSIGYALWGDGNYQYPYLNLRYLTVDNIDPLYDGTSPNPLGVGAIPACTSVYPSIPVCPSLKYPNVVNGSYPLWSMIRVMYDPADSTITNFIPLLAQNMQKYLVPVSSLYSSNPLRVFHSHYDQVVSTDGTLINGSNGFKSNFPEAGGDMGGAILTNQSEIDFVNDTGDQQINLFQ